MAQSKVQRIAILVALLATQQAKVDATRLRLIAAEDSREETQDADLIHAGLPAGTTVEFRFGRGEKVRDLFGTVVGSKPQDKGPTQYRIRAGEGFDEEVYKVFGVQITSHNFVPTPTESGADVNEGAASEADPLDFNNGDPTDNV